MLEYFPPQFFDVINISDAIFPSEIFLYFTVMKGCITCDLYFLYTWTSSLLHFSLSQF